MRLSVLLKEQWGRLEQIQGDVVPLPNPDRTVAFIAENEDGSIIGRIYVGFFPVEFGPWIREDNRNGVVLGHLQRKLERALAAQNYHELYAFTNPATETCAMFEDYAERCLFERSGWVYWRRNLESAKVVGA